MGELLGISAKVVRQRIAAKLEEQGFINFHRSIEISARMKSQRPGGSERDKTRGEKVTKTSKRETRTRCSPNVMASVNVRENVPSESFDWDDGGEARQILLMILPRFSPLDRDPL